MLHLTRSLGIKAGTIKDTRQICELLWECAKVNHRHEISRRVLALVRQGKTTIEALREVCGADVTDAMIDELYTELRARATA